MIKLTLSSVPPSVNKSKIPIRKKGRNQMIKSPELRAWHDQAILELRMQHRKLSGLGYWRSDILIPRRLTRCDVDNHVKAIHDALHKAGITPDDRYLVDSRVRFSNGDKVVIALKMETEKWLTIMKPSRSLTKRLAK